MSKVYRVYAQPQDRLKEMIFSHFGQNYGYDFWALRDVSFTLSRGERLGVIGRNGSGKSTLLQILGGLDDPDEGRALVTGVDWRTLHGRARARFRRRTCGFIPQSMSLLPPVTAAENV